MWVFTGTTTPHAARRTSCRWQGFMGQYAPAFLAFINTFWYSLDGRKPLYSFACCHIHNNPFYVWFGVLYTCPNVGTAAWKNSTLALALGRDKKGIISIVIYFVGIPISFYNSWISLSLVAIVAAIWFIPDSRIEKKLKVEDDEKKIKIKTVPVTGIFYFFMSRTYRLLLSIVASHSCTEDFIWLLPKRKLIVRHPEFISGSSGVLNKCFARRC